MTPSVTDRELVCHLPASLTPGRTRPSGSFYGVAASILEGLDGMLTVNNLHEISEWHIFLMAHSEQ
jgi:hypothetical protein